MEAEPGGRSAEDRPVALLLLTRDPTGQSTGRKAVLRTAARSLEASGLQVVAVVLARRPVDAQWEGRPMHRVPLPGLLRVALSAGVVLVLGRGSLNEALFDSPAVRRRTARLASSSAAKIVVADGLRTAGPALACDPPVVVHLDDLLSDRYAAMAGSTGAGREVLGFFGQQLPAVLRRPAAALATALVALEARRTHRREREVTKAAAAVAMTSPAEADELSRRTGRAVAALPMSVAARRCGDPARAPQGSFVFIGLLDYAPNRAALHWWLDAVVPALDASGGGDVVLTVVGEGSRDGRLPQSPRLRFTGYVQDLGQELRRHRGMVAPLLSGGGVKTKVLDGWSVGLPVVATPAGASGLDGETGLLVARDANAFARHVLRLRDDGALATSVGRSGRALLLEEWSPAALAGRWGEFVAPLLR